MNTFDNSSFYIIAYEPGADNPALPTWANTGTNPARLAEDFAPDSIVREDLPEVPGGYQLFNVLSAQECRRLIELSESLGSLEDAAVSLPREIRHSDNVVWVTDEKTDGIIWHRVAHLVARDLAVFDGKRPLGLNARFRFYRYGPGDYFKFHSDGAWPGSRVVDGQLVANAYDDRYSLLTFLLFLNDDYEGGATGFLVDADDPSGPARRNNRVRLVDVRTPAGGALCFPHGLHPLHCVHSGETIIHGTKYIIRTDVLFEL